MLGHIAEAEMRDPITRQARDIAALEQDAALRRDFAHDGLDGRGAADAVAAEQADHPAGIHIHIHPPQDLALSPKSVRNPALHPPRPSSPRKRSPNLAFA